MRVTDQGPLNGELVTQVPLRRSFPSSSTDSNALVFTRGIFVNGRHSVPVPTISVGDMYNTHMRVELWLPVLWQWLGCALATESTAAGPKGVQRSIGKEFRRVGLIHSIGMLCINKRKCFVEK